MRPAPSPPPSASCATGGLGARTAVGIIDTLLQDRGWLEDHHAARRDRHFLAGLGISPDALAFLAHHEGTEGRQLHRIASFKAIGDLLQHHFHKCGRFRAGKPYLLVDGLAQIRPCHCLCSHRLPRLRRLRYPSVFSHDISLTGYGQRGRSAKHNVLPYHLTWTAPQVKPPPMASSSTRSPRLMRRSATASA